MTATELRRATRADAATIGGLHVAAWRESYKGILPDDVLAALSVDARTAMWDRVLADPDASGGAVLFVVDDVADDGTRAVGFGACFRNRDTTLADAGFDGEIGAVYILRAHQRRGAGRGLLRAMAQAMRDAGHVGASLWVLRDNATARGFYEALGGAIVGERTDRQSAVPLVEIAYGWPDLARLAR